MCRPSPDQEVPMKDERRRRSSWLGLPGRTGAVVLLLAALVAGTSARLTSPEGLNGWEKGSKYVVEVDLHWLVGSALAATFALWWMLTAKRRVYLLNFACYTPPKELHTTLQRFMRGSRSLGAFQQEALDFQERISHRNGLGNSTSFPAALHLEPPRQSMEDARDEARLVLFGAVEEALRKTGLTPKDIDILVVNCSLFNPTPSLSAMIVNHFHMRSDIISYNLAGMGCSAGVIAIGLAQQVLQTLPNKYALVVSTENITQNWYTGQDRSMLIPNTLFRMGAAAMVLTNHATERYRAKYLLQHIVRVHLGADDVAYECVYQREDDAGVVGVSLNRDLVKVAGKALERNLTRLGPLVLPVSEQLRFAANFVARKMLRGTRKAYVPDFRKAFRHFCLHAGGRGVIEGLGGQLGLSKRQLEPSYSALYWYGNTSSASVWYELSYIEAKQRVRKGDTVWQVGFGSGFKCNSAVWRAMRCMAAEPHTAWDHVGEAETAAMWRHLEEVDQGKKP